MKKKIGLRYSLFLSRFPYLALCIVLIFSAEASVGQSTADRTEVNIERANLCDLFSDLPRYKGKIFDVDAIYVVGFETGWLDNKVPCSESGLKWATKFRTAENFDAESEPKVLKKFDKLLKKRTVGTPRRISGSFRVMIKDYYHNGGFDKRYEFEFVVLRVNSVE